MCFYGFWAVKVICIHLHSSPAPSGQQKQSTSGPTIQVCWLMPFLPFPSKTDLTKVGKVFTTFERSPSDTQCWALSNIVSCRLLLTIPASFIPHVHSWLFHQYKNWNVICGFTWRAKDKPFFMIMLQTNDWIFHIKTLCGLLPKASQIKLLVPGIKDGVQKVGGRCLKRNIMLR